MDSREYSGKRILVTGGTKGAGEAIVRRLAAGGAVIATTARSGLPEGLTPDVFVQADLSTPEGVSKVAETVLREPAYEPFWGLISETRRVIKEPISHTMKYSSRVVVAFLALAFVGCQSTGQPPADIFPL